MLLSFQYINLQNLTVGNLAYELVDGDYTPLSVCQEFYRKSSVFPANETFDIDPHIDKGACVLIRVFNFESLYCRRGRRNGK